MALQPPGICARRRSRHTIHSRGSSMAPLEATGAFLLMSDWVDEVRVNTSAVERRAAIMHAAHRSRRKSGGVAAPRHCLHGPDHARGDDSADRIGAVRQRPAIRCSAIWSRASASKNCTFNRRRRLRVSRLRRNRGQSGLEGSGIPVAAVSAGFPPAYRRSPERVGEIRRFDGSRSVGD